MVLRIPKDDEKCTEKHNCSMNYEGKTSKAMEADCALRMALEIYTRYKGKVCISEFVSDDDESTRKILTNKNEEGKGGLPVDMIAPKFVCDVNI